MIRQSALPQLYACSCSCTTSF